MTKNKRFLKSILTTSAMGFALLSAESAMGAAAVLLPTPGPTTAANVVAANGGNWAVSNGNGAGLTIAADNLVGGVIVNHTGVTIATTAGGGAIGSIASNGNDATKKATLTVGHNLTLVGAGNAAVLGADGLALANTYSGLGATTITAGILEINMGAGFATFSNTFDGAGELRNSDDGTVLQGNIGNAVTLGTLTVNGNTTIGGAGSTVTVAKMTTSNIANGKTLTVDSTANAITLGVAGGNINAANAGNGTLALTGPNTITVASAVGNGAALVAVTTGAGAVNFSDVVKATTVTTNAGAVTFTKSVTGNLNLANAGSQVTFGDGATVSGTLDNTSGVAGKGTVITGATDIAIGNSIGNTNSIAELRTAAGKVTLGGAVNKIEKLNIGAGNVTTANDVTVGSATAETGVVGSGTLTFTANKTLKLQTATTKEAVSASNRIIVGTAGAGNALTIDVAPQAVAGFYSVINGAIQTGGNAASTLIFQNTGNAGVARVTKDIGDSTAAGTFASVTVTPGNDGDALSLYKNVKAYATLMRLNGVNAGLHLHSGSAAVGTITPVAANDGKITVYGNTGGNTTKLGPNALGLLTFHENADKNSTFTYLSDDVGGAGSTKTFTSVVFNGAAGDAGGIVVDMKDVNAANTTTVSVTGMTHRVDGSTGTIAFKNSKSAVVVTAGGNLGSFTKHLAAIDAGESTKLTLNGANALHVGKITAKEVVLDNINLAVYGAGATKYTMTAANSTILTKSAVGTKEAPVTLNFKGNGTLTIADNNDKIEDVSPFYASAITVDEALATGNGTVLLQGNSKLVVGAVAAKEKALTGINITTAINKTVEITSIGDAKADVYSPITFVGSTSSTKLKLGVNVHGNVTTDTDNRGVVVLQGGNVDGHLGGANALTQIQIDTKDKVTVGETTGATVGAKATYFEQDGTLAIHKNAAATPTLGTITTKDNNTGTLELNQNTTLTAVGDEDKALKKISVGEKSEITVQGKLWAKNVVTTENNQGTIKFNTNDSTSTTTSIGSSDARFALVKADTAGKTVKLDQVYAKDIQVAAGATLAAKRFDATSSNGTALLAGSTAQVLDGGYLGKLTSTGASTVLVDGDATLDQNIGTAGAANIVALRLNGAAGKVVTFNGDTLNVNLIQGASTLALAKDTTVAGTSAFTGSTLDLGKNKLTLAGAATFSGDTTVKFVYTAGKPIITLGSTATVGAATDKITLVKSKGGSYLRSGTKVSVFGDANGNTVAITGADKDTINFANTRFLKANIDSVAGTVTFLGAAEDTSFASASALKNSNVKAFVTALKDFANNDKGNDVKTEEFLGMLDQLPSDAKVSEAIERVTDRSGAGSVVANVGLETLNAGVSSMTNRMGQVATYAGSPVGVAAGSDATERFGVWAEAKIGSADQKLRKDVSGFKSKMFGGVVGIDTMLNDAATLGVMVGNINGNVKFKDVKSGDKNKSTSWLFGAYGGYEFANNFFVQGNAAVAQTNVKSKERRVSLNGYDTATGKYDIMGYVAEVRGGYNYRFEASTITPTVGLRYNYFGDTSYTETGNNTANLKAATKSASSLSGVAGVKLGTTVDVNGSAITPEVHMNVDYALSKSAPKATYSLDGSSMNINYKGAKPARFGYNFGASVMTKNDNVEYGVGYDANIADKYLGHQGSLKVRMAF